MYTKAERDRIHRRQKNSRCLIQNVRAKFMEPAFNGSTVERCIYTRHYDLAELERGFYPIFIRYQNDDVTVIAFKRNRDVPDPSPLEDANGYLIEDPDF